MGVLQDALERSVGNAKEILYWWKCNFNNGDAAQKTRVMPIVRFSRLRCNECASLSCSKFSVR